MHIFILHLASTLYLCGLIWFVQLVHYPLMAKVGEARFKEYEEAHVKWTSWAVGPAMLTEVFTGVILLLHRPDVLNIWLLAATYALLVVIWVATLLASVPAHSKLARGFNAKAHRFLVSTNWIRTVCWTARAVVLLWMLSHALTA